MSIITPKVLMIAEGDEQPQDISIKETVYLDILKVIEKFTGTMISNSLLYEIQRAIYHKLAGHVMAGQIDAIKWHDNHEIKVTLDPDEPSRIIIGLPKWLEDWLESDDEES